MKCGSIVNHRKPFASSMLVSRPHGITVDSFGLKGRKTRRMRPVGILMGHTGNAFDFDVRLGDRVFAEKSPVHL